MMDVAKILSVVFAGDTGDKGTPPDKALGSNNFPDPQHVPQVSPSEIPWGTNTELGGDSEVDIKQQVTGACPPVPRVPHGFADENNHGEDPDPGTFEERAAIIHEAHARTRADDGAPLPEPIFEITQEQAEILAAQEQGHADAGSLHGATVERWATEIERLAKLPAVSPDGAEALKRARAFIADGWALQAARLGWDEVELFGVCPRAPWQRLDTKGAAFGGTVVAVTAAAITYVGGLRRYRAQVNNDGGAVLIWELAGDPGEA